MTNLFPTKNELIRIHETDFKTIKRLPDFDVDTVVVALQKIGQFQLIIVVITCFSSFYDILFVSQ